MLTHLECVEMFGREQEYKVSTNFVLIERSHRTGGTPGLPGSRSLSKKGVG
jgi:hypothetical protein